MTVALAPVYGPGQRTFVSIAANERIKLICLKNPSLIATQTADSAPMEKEVWR